MMARSELGKGNHFSRSWMWGREREKGIFRNKGMWSQRRFYFACLFICGMQYIGSYLSAKSNERVERERRLKGQGDNLQVMVPEERGGGVIKDTGISPLERIVLFKIKVVLRMEENVDVLGREDGGVLS